MAVATPGASSTLNKTMFSILRVLERNRDAVGSLDLSRELLSHGIELSERTVRYYLKLLDGKGLTRVNGKKGRTITEQGRRELNDSFVSQRLSFVISRIESLSCLTDLSLDDLKGNIILNISFFPEAKMRETLRVMANVFGSPYVMSDRIVLGGGGERIGDVAVPEGAVGIGTVCSVTINGIFLKAGIPVASRYGGVVEIHEGEAVRFTSLISYEGSSMDPLEVFIRSRMTDVLGVMRGGSGRVLASFREIPVVAMTAAQELKSRMARKGLGGKILFGKPNQPLLDIPVGSDKAGMLVAGGLNPVAAAEESGIRTESVAMSTLFEHSRLLPFNDAVSAFLFR